MKTSVKELAEIRIKKSARDLMSVRAELKALKEREKLLKSEIKTSLEELGYDTNENVSAAYGSITITISHQMSTSIDMEALKKNDWYESFRAEYPKVTRKEVIKVK